MVKILAQCLVTQWMKKKVRFIFIAINISSFVDLEIFKSRMSEMINSLKEPSLNEKNYNGTW